MAFLRSRDETAACFELPGEPPGPLRHGDVLYDTRGYRAERTRVAVAAGPGGAVRLERVCDDAGYGFVRRHISALIEDPAAFYAAAPLDAEVWGVELDAAAHQGLLAAAAGRAVDATRSVHWQRRGGLFIRTPRSRDRPLGPVYVPLDASTPGEYLGGADALGADPLVGAARRANQLRHGAGARAYLDGLAEGAPLGTRSLPGAGLEGAWAGREWYCGYAADAAGAVTSVRTVTADGTLCEYRRRAVTAAGPFRGVAVWAAPALGQAPERMLSLGQ